MLSLSVIRVMMSRNDRCEFVIWYSNWRAGWKLQLKDMKFFQIKAWHGGDPYTVVNKTFEKFRYVAMISLKDFFS